MKILEATHLTKKYGHHLAVDDLSLTVEDGQFIAFLGPNGAGKSTTIQMLTTLLDPTSGSVKVSGETDTQKIRKHIGIVFQESVLDDNLSVRTNLEIRARMYHHLGSTRVKEVLQQVDGLSFEQQTYGSLSGGQKRRVDIARALLNRPEILFLDEPTTGLDIQTRSKIWQVLREMQNKSGLTIFLTTHYLEEAERANNVFIVDHGRLIAHGTADELKRQFTSSQLMIHSSHYAQLVAKLSDDWDHFAASQSETEIVKMVSDQDAIRLLQDNAGLITSFEYHHGSMDDVFLALTGRGIR